MSVSKDKPKEYFKKLLEMTEPDIDYSDAPPTTREQWEDAEVLLPVTRDEFQVLREFIENRRKQHAVQRGAAAAER